MLPSKDVDLGSEDKWDDIKEVALTRDGQVTKLGTNAGEEDTFDAAEEDLFDAAEED